MEWLVKPNSIKLDDACLGYTCGDRTESCTDKNACGYKFCGTRYCIINI